MPGKGTSKSNPHGPSIKNPVTYQALRDQGMSKSKAAQISNGVLKNGVKKGVHHGTPPKGK